MAGRRSWQQVFYSDFERAFRDKMITRFNEGGGYSLVDEYPAKYIRQMGVPKDANVKPFFKYFYLEDQMTDGGLYVPLIVTVSLTTEDSTNGTVRYMLNDSRIKRLKPIELTSKEDFYVNTSNGKVYEKHRNSYSEVALSDIHKRILKLHISNWHTPKGAVTRLRLLFTQRLLSWLFKIIAWSSGRLFWYIKSKPYNYDVIRERYLNSPRDSRNQGTPSPNPPGGIDFFGYKVSIWTLFTYSISVLVLCYFFRENIVPILKELESLSSIITIALAILTIVTYDKLLPLLLILIVKGAENLSFDLSIKSVKLRV